MIEFKDVGVSYQDRPVLRDVDLVIDDGQFALVAGRTGAGKSTLLGAVNGHVPHFTGGTLSGRVTVDSLDTRLHPPRDLAAVVGVVWQDPLRGFVTDTVEEEVVYGMEQLGFEPAVMRRRVEDVLDLLSIADLRTRALRSLSGGQQQRVAIASVLAAGARYLVLDEPTSALDPASAEEVLAALLRLVDDLGITVVIAEHRLERVLEYADQLIWVGDDGHVSSGPPSSMMTDARMAPPVVGLGLLADWSPLPLGVRDARRQAGPLRQRLAGVTPDDARRAPEGAGVANPRTSPSQPSGDSSNQVAGLQADGLLVRYGTVVAVRDASLTLPAGSITALMGRNGAGKSSLLWALTGVLPVQAGRWRVGGADLSKADVAAIRQLVRLVPQEASDLLYLDSVGEECATADRQNGCAAGACRAILDALSPSVPDGQHPSDLSEGQRLCLVLAIQSTSRPAVLLLDEPTRGLDYPGKAALGQVLRQLANQGSAICLSTHDVEFAAQFADRAIVMAQGDLIQCGPVAEVLTASTSLAPQVAKVMSPARWLTVPQVADGLERAS